jgi:hypothetical protein
MSFPYTRLRVVPCQLLLGSCMALWASSSQAALDGTVASIEADRARFHAVVPNRVSQAAYSVHTLTLTNNTQVHEYLGTSGKVFAVTWQGRSIPDLRQLLGVHYVTFSSSGARHRNGLGHLVVQDNAQHPNLVVESHGRQPGFHGRAYLLQSLPAGVSLADIR